MVPFSPYCSVLYVTDTGAAQGNPEIPFNSTGTSHIYTFDMLQTKLEAPLLTNRPLLPSLMVAILMASNAILQATRLPGSATKLRSGTPTTCSSDASWLMAASSLFALVKRGWFICATS